MAEISAKDVMKLRNKTGLPMMACKKALGEANGDMEEAENILRKSLKGKMDSKADRPAGEGRVTIATNADGSAAAIIEVRAETDFTAKNDRFIAAVEKAAQLALQGDDGEQSPTEEMTAAMDDVRISTGENCSIARITKVAGGPGVKFGAYIHHDGKMAVLVVGNGVEETDILRKVGMHVAAAHPVPLGVTPDDIPSKLVEKEKKFRIEQAMESGKNQEIAEKMVEGGMKKFFSEVALLEQDFVIDPSKKIRDLLGKGTVTRFYRWQVGAED